jgi:cysteine desulfurase
MNRRRIYLDTAAAHPVRSRAKRAFLKALSAYGNPSAPHVEGVQAARILEDARERIAKLTGAKSDAVIFTSGATESNALAILGHLRARITSGEAPESLELLYCVAQHASVIGAVEEARRLGITAHAIPFADGALDIPALRAMLSPRTALITLDVICGETGTRFDTRAVRALIDETPLGKRPVFHVDATQAPLVENIERTRLGADLISFDAQKIGGVRGIGALIAPRNVALSPLVEGGGQERGLRSGTPSPALAAAFAVALEDAARERESFALHATRMKAEMIDVLLKDVPGMLVNSGKESAPHILSVSLPGRDTDYLAALLDDAGVAVATRSACETDAEGSRVVLALTNDPARAASALRASLHAKTLPSDLRVFHERLLSALRVMDAAG